MMNHSFGRVLSAGADVGNATTVVILLHGRGATPQSLLPLVDELASPPPPGRIPATGGGHLEDEVRENEARESTLLERAGTPASPEPGTARTAFLLPGARGGQWYPRTFLAPVEENEPYLSNALEMITNLLGYLREDGVTADRVMLGGFSQGACLALEYAARHPARYAGVFALSGGLIGPPGGLRPYAAAPDGDLRGTPVFLGCAEVDAHIPRERVLESAEVMERLGARVTAKLYPDLGHSINEDEVEIVRQMIRENERGSIR